MEAPDQSNKPSLKTWLLFSAVFVAAVVATVVVVVLNSSDESEYPDLGDIAESDPNLPSKGEAAPPFTVTTMDGDTFDLGAHLANDGRPLVLNLWASWCPPCRAEMPAINTASDQHPEVAFIGVAVKDEPEDATAFATEIGITYTIGLDDGSVDKAYPALGLPATFYIDGNGTLVKIHVGPVTLDSLNEDIAELFGA